MCRHSGRAVEQQPRKRGYGHLHIQCPESGLLRFATSLLLLMVSVFSLGLGRVGFEGKLLRILIFILRKSFLKKMVVASSFQTL